MVHDRFTDKAWILSRVAPLYKVGYMIGSLEKHGFLHSLHLFPELL